MIPFLLVTALVCAAPATRPTASVDGLRARVADLQRRELDDLRALIRLADAAGDTMALRKAYRQLDLLGAASPDDRLRLAVLCLKSGALAEARGLLADLRRANRADLRYVYLLAAVEERTGRGAERDDLLKAAARLHPTDKKAHVAAGDFLVRTGLERYAEREWRRVLALKQEAPTAEDIEAHVRLAGLARNRREYANAIGHYRAALEVTADEHLDVPRETDEWLTVELAMSLRDAGQVAEARTHRPAVERFYRRRLLRDPSDVEACNALGWFYAGIGEKLDEGVELVKTALTAQPNRPEFLDTLAELHFRKDDPRRALDLIERAIAAKPRDLDYYRGQRAKFKRAVEQQKDVQP